MRCKKCGHDNDYDATFCEKCGANLRAPAGMSSLTKGLIVAVIILVAVLGVVAGAMMMNNQTTPANNTSVNQSTDDSGQTTTQTTTPTTSAYKTFSNGVISFQYPSSWDVLPNGANTMAVVGTSDYPHFSVYDESKYGYTGLQAYVTSSIKGMKEDGFTVRSQRNMTVDGLPATELIYQGDSKILHMVLVERSKGTYYALEGADNANNYDQSKSIFNQIIGSFRFL